MIEQLPISREVLDRIFINIGEKAVEERVFPEGLKGYLLG